MANKEVRLEPVSWENIDDVIATSDSGEGFFDLPRDDDAAERFISRAHNNMRQGKGGVFNAYAAQDVFVGGGQIYDMHETIQIGYWVALSKRRQGFGRAILTALEREARETLPVRESFELEIRSQNMASLALAVTMGYTFLQTREDGVMMYRKGRS